MITKTLINDVAAEIGTVLETSDLFQHVSSHPVSTFQGFPAVEVVVSENENSYNSTGGNDARRITLSFTLNVYQQITKESNQQKAELVMREAVSELLRLFLRKKPLTTCDLATVTNTPFSTTTEGEAVYRMASVILTCTVFVDIA